MVSRDSSNSRLQQRIPPDFGYVKMDDAFVPNKGAASAIAQDHFG